MFNFVFVAALVVFPALGVLAAVEYTEYNAEKVSDVPGLTLGAGFRDCSTQSNLSFSFTLNGTTTYYLINRPSPVIYDMDGAVSYCQSQTLGGYKAHLACIETMEEFVAINGAFSGANCPRRDVILPNRSNRNCYWLFGADLYLNSGNSTKGKFWFCDGSRINPAMWNQGEPNDSQTGIQNGCNAVSETCVNLKVKTNGTYSFGLNDELCNTRCSVLCEATAPPSCNP